MRSSNVGQDREEAVDQRVDHEVHHDQLGRRRLAHEGVAIEVLLHVPERVAHASVQGDDVAVRPEAVHLLAARVVGVGAAGDEEDEGVVVVDARALGEALARLNRQRVEAEASQQRGHFFVARLVVEVEPEEARPRQRGRNVLLGGGRVGAVLAERPLQHAASLTAARCAGVDAPPNAGRPPAPLS